jgi:hypothetical protein
VYHAVKEGFSPFYTFMYYCGFPALRFYSPLFYLLGGPLTLLTGGDLLLALRILQVLLHLLSALAMYVYLGREGRGERKDDRAGFGPALGTIVYLVIPWRTLYLTGCSNYPQTLVYVLLPLVLLAFDNIVEAPEPTGKGGGGTRQGLLLALWVGLLFLAHLVYAIFTLLFLVVWWVARAAERRAGPRAAGGLWRSLGIAVPASIGVSAFFLIPFAAEQAAHRFPITHLNLSVPNLIVLLGFRIRVGGYEGVYFGLSVALLLLAATAAVLFNRAFRSQVPALVGLAGGLLLTFGPALLREKQYLITTGLPPERFLVFVLFFIALLVPSAYELARRALDRRVARGVIFGVMAGLVMLDCLFSVLHATYSDRGEFLSVREEVYPIADREPHARLVDLNIPEPRVDDVRRTCRLPTVGVIYGNLPTPLGLPYHQYAPRSMLHVYPWVDYIARDLGDTARQLISDNTHKALALLGASHFLSLPTLVNASGTREGPFYMVLKREMDWEDRFVAAQREPPVAMGRTYQGLVLASSRVAPMGPDTLAADGSFIVARNWQRLLDSVKLDGTNRCLSFIPGLAGTNPESLPGLPALVIDSTRIRHQDVVTGLRVSADCFLRIAVSYYPELEVTLDGRPVQFSETADHFTWIRCPAGAHVLRVTARFGALRFASLLLSLVSLPVVLVMILRRRRGRPAGDD